MTTYQTVEVDGKTLIVVKDPQRNKVLAQILLLLRKINEQRAS